MTEAKFKSFIINTLRRASYRWSPRGEAMKLARIERGQYECASCEEIFKNKDIQVDHIAPIVDPKRGFTTWDEYIARMFCPVEGFQVLCKPCHEKKTNKEKDVRKVYRAKKKKNS